MSTQFTSALAFKGQRFEDFFWTCAAGIGAPVQVSETGKIRPELARIRRDERETAARLAAAERALQQVIVASKLDPHSLGERFRAEEIGKLKRELAQVTPQNTRLVAMRTRVESWEPDTPSGTELKAFMLKQLNDSLTDPAWYAERLNWFERASTRTLVAEALRHARITHKTIRESYRYSAAQVQRAERRVAELRRSLPGKTSQLVAN